MKKIIPGIIFISSLLSVNVFAQNNSYKPFTMPKRVTAEDYLPNTIDLKVKDKYRHYCELNRIEVLELNKLLQGLEGYELNKKFPKHQKPKQEYNRYGQKLVDISLMYGLKYKADIAIDKAINALLATGVFEYAEPHYIAKAYYTPNDYNSQQSGYLNKIKLPEAWDVQKGNPSIIIGISDSGTEPTHPDLKGNMFVNPGEIAGNSLDDDNNGYIDDVSGWDFGVGDNDPTWQGLNHGSHVTGIASATTDNGTGVVGVGFKCKHIVAKGANSSGGLTAVFDGIPYLADMGAKVINCSWGVTAGGQYNEDLCNYAIINKDVVIVAATGNEGLDVESYPASFDNVIAVGATLNNDYRGSYSNHGYYVDVMAPGSSIYSTLGSSYGTLTGTSMASPIVAGVVALIRTQYPTYTALQTAALIKATCDDIYSIGFNSSYIDKLGSGRINAYRALTETTNKAAGMNIPPAITDKNDDIFVGGDTMYVTGNFTNYLSPLSNLTATLTSSDANITIVDGISTLGAMNTLDTKKNTTDAFKIYIKPSVPLNSDILFKLTLSDGSYSDNFYFKISVNVDYINVNVNDVATSVTSKSLIGYNENGQKTGLGFNYNSKGTVLYEAGLMVGTSSTKVSDNIRSGKSTYNNDFKSLTRVYKVTTNTKSDFDTKGTFNDEGATSPLKITVNHSSYAFSSPGHRKYVILEYIIKNKGASSLTNLYAGLFADWDIVPTILENKVETDATNKMGYAYCTTSGSMYTGIKLLTSSAPFNHYATDLVTGGGGGVSIPDGFTDAEKYTTLSTSRPTAGNTATKGNDIGSTVSTGPFAIAAGDSIKVAFALIGGDDLTDLKASAVTAQSDYDMVILGVEAMEFPKNYETIIAYPNPANNVVFFNYLLSTQSNTQLSIINSLGETVTELVNENESQGKHSIVTDLSSCSPGIYFYKLTTNSKVLSGKLIINSK